MDQAQEKKPSRWEVFLGWLTMVGQSPEEHIIEYLQQVEARLQQLERSLPQGRADQSPSPKEMRTDVTAPTARRVGPRRSL